MAYILVVDDEQSIREVLEIAFRKQGHRVELAATAEAAKKRLESQIFDIIISNIRMPGGGGVDLLRLALGLARSCHFLFITGGPTLDTDIASLNSGADRYVIKDHELVDQLRSAVQQVAENLQ